MRYSVVLERTVEAAILAGPIMVIVCGDDGDMTPVDVTSEMRANATESTG